jgi:hypothetical protein
MKEELTVYSERVNCSLIVLSMTLKDFKVIAMGSHNDLLTDRLLLSDVVSLISMEPVLSMTLKDSWVALCHLHLRNSYP